MSDNDEFVMENFVNTEMGLLHLMIMDLILNTMDLKKSEDQKKKYMKERIREFILHLIEGYDSIFHSSDH